MSKVTVRDVAREAGVSPATVSNVLNNRPKVSNEVRKRVLEVCRRLGYRRRTAARRQRFSVTAVIRQGDVRSGWANPYYSHVLAGLQQALSLSCRLQLASVPIDENETAYSDLLFTSASQVDGLVLVGYQNPGLLTYLQERSVPLVMVDHHHPAVRCIVVDNLRAAMEAVQHLVRLGHSKIGFIGGPQAHSSMEERYWGYCLALAQAGVPVKSSYVKMAAVADIDDGQQAAAELLDRCPELTALFCANDSLALGALQTARQRGLKVPADLSLVGFDDLDVARAAHPRLTTVHVDADELGRNAAEELMAAMKSQTNRSPLRIMHWAHLVVRESTSSPKTG